LLTSSVTGLSEVKRTPKERQGREEMPTPGQAGMPSQSHPKNFPKRTETHCPSAYICDTQSLTQTAPAAVYKYNLCHINVTMHIYAYKVRSKTGKPKGLLLSRRFTSVFLS